MIHALNDLRTGTEIVAEQHLSSLPRLSTFGRFVGFVLFQENPRVGQTELVDRLFHIPNEEAVLLFPAQHGKDCVLHAVGVLILVHQNLPVSATDLCRGSCGACPGFTQQQVKGAVFQIAEIQNPAASLG